MSYPTTYTWNFVPQTESFIPPPSASDGPAGIPTRRQTGQFTRGVKFANVPDSNPINIVHGGPRVYHVNSVMTIIQRPSDKYFGDEPDLLSGVIRFRGHESRMVRVPAKIRGTNPGFVSLTANPVAAFSSSLEVPLTVSFFDQSTDAEHTIIGWTWDFGDGSGSIVQNPTHIYSTPGTYDVFLVVTSSVGLTNQVSHDVGVF